MAHAFTKAPEGPMHGSRGLQQLAGVPTTSAGPFSGGHQATRAAQALPLDTPRVVEVPGARLAGLLRTGPALPRTTRCSRQQHNMIHTMLGVW
jgi:hypothetical protein